MTAETGRRQQAGQVSPPRGVKQRPDQAASATWQARKAAQRALLEARARSKEAAFKVAMQAKAAAAAEAQERAFQSLLADVLGGLQPGGVVVAEAQALLDATDAARSARAAALHQQWSSQVFDKITERIQHAMACCPGSAPGRLGSGDSIRVATSDLCDPLKADLLRAAAEKSLLAASSRRGSGSAAGSVRLARAATRPMLAVAEWGAGKINATPYGHCIDAAGCYCVKPPSALRAAMGASHVVADDFGPPPPPEAWRPSKHMTAPAARCGRADLGDIVSHTCYLHPGVTGGDAWLEARGKRFVDSPEVSRGRRGLAEVLAQSSNPYADGRALDDAWLTQRGKRRVPVPGAQVTGA